MNKKGQVTALVIVLLVIVAGILVYVMWRDFGPNITGNTVYSKDNNGNSGSTNNPSYQQCRTVQVPYTDTEQYTESVPYIDYECDYNYDNNVDYEAEYDNGRSLRTKIDLFDGDDPIEGSEDYYIENEGNRDAEFTVRVVYYDDDNDRITSYVHDRIDVDEDDREEETIDLDDVFDKKPRSAESFNIEVSVSDDDDEDSCDTRTRYKEELRTRTVTRYRTQQICE